MNKIENAAVRRKKMKVNVRVFCYQLIAVNANTGIVVQKLMNYQR